MVHSILISSIPLDLLTSKCMLSISTSLDYADVILYLYGDTAETKGQSNATYKEGYKFNTELVYGNIFRCKKVVFLLWFISITC